jgi:hypothetical protein
MSPHQGFFNRPVPSSMARQIWARARKRKRVPVVIT